MAAQARMTTAQPKRFVWTILRKALAWLLLIIGLYFLGTLIGAIIGVNNEWREPEQGIEIFVETNGVHTAIIVPKRSVIHDWSAFLPTSHLSDPSNTGDYLSFSWGHRQFYLETESWGDIQAGTVASILIGSDDTLMHIYHMRKPRDGDIARRLVISEGQYDRLVSVLTEKFAFNADGSRPDPIAGYGRNDIFYESNGRYTLINTCNTWTGDTLAAIGVRVGAWTPMAGGVMRWFPKEAAAN